MRYVCVKNTKNHDVINAPCRCSSAGSAGGRLVVCATYSATSSPAGTCSVPLKMSFAYHTGPGMSRILSLSPPYFFAKLAEKIVSFANAAEIPFTQLEKPY